jgi:hypothetical protein
MFLDLPDLDSFRIRITAACIRCMDPEHWHAGSAAMDHYLKILPVCLHQAATGTVLEDSCNSPE